MENYPVLTAEIIDSNHDNTSVLSGNNNNTSTSDSYYDYSYKLIIIGNSGTGKSSLIKSAVSSEFNNDYQTTIAFEYSSMMIKVNNRNLSFFNIKFLSKCFTCCAFVLY